MSVQHRPYGRALLALVTLLASLVLSAVPVGSATLSDGVIGGFEQDGNEILDGLPGATLDWEKADDLGTVTVVEDDTADSGFTQGSKELDPDGWVCGTGGADPGKANILTAFVNPRVSATDVFLDLAFIRELGDESGGKGDVHLNFEFNQADVDEPGEFAPGPCGIDRRVGDMLITYDFPGGSDAPTIEVYRWAASKGGEWVNHVITDDQVAGAVNDEVIEDPVGGYGTLARQRFGEASLDLENILQPESGDPECISFGSVNVRSRSSGESITSMLQDKLPSWTVDFSTCGSIDLVKKGDGGELLSGAKFQLYLDDSDGVFDDGVDTPVGDECTTDAQGICDWDDLNPGAYFVKETAAPEGYSIHLPAGGVYGPIELGFRESVSLEAEFVNFKWLYRLNLTPDATNLVGTDHVFTATLEVKKTDDGSYAPAAGETLGTNLSGLGSVVSPGASCETDAAGECDITIHSDDPGDSVLSVSFDDKVTSLPVDADDQAVKHWVDYRIAVEEDAVNLVGDEHVFAVTLTKDSGAGFGLLAGAEVALDWSGGAGSSVDADSCVTDAAGQCKVTVKSSTPLTGTLTASFKVTLDSGTHTFTADSQKRWMNWALSVTPEQAENLVGTNHTFAVKVSRDEGKGAGMAALAGAKPTISLAGKGSIVASTCDAGTDAAGLCTVTITSSEPGASTVKATFSATEDQASVSLSASGQKRWVDYRITVTPETAVNPVGTTHTFDVKLEKNIGDGFVVAGSEAISLGLTGVGSITAVDAGAVGSNVAAVCTTDTAGTCRVTITSLVGGLDTLQASYAAQVGETSRTYTDSGEKNWVAVLGAVELPRTGAALVGQAWLAVSLVGAGVALRLAGRRRRGKMPTG